MHLFDEIRAFATTMPTPELLERMGYSTNLGQHASRLDRVLEDPDMGLSPGEYDFVHDSRGFLLALCTVLGMDEAAAALRLDDIIARIEERDATYRPWLRVESRETDDAAHRRGVFGHWGASLDRKVPLRDGAAGAPLEDIIAMARETIRGHMLETDGKLKTGAGIDGYLLMHHAYRPALRMDTAGNVVGVQKPKFTAGA